MSWTAATLPILVAIGLLVAPGLAIAWCLGMRNFSGLALAPVFSTSVVGVFGILGGWADIPWSVGLYLAGTLSVAFVALVVVRFFHISRPAPKSVIKDRRSWVPLILAVSAGAIIIAWRLMQLFQTPENVSQRFDNVFHLNAIRFILDSGNASTLNLGSMSGATGLAALYPAAWHSFVALVSQLTNTSIPVAVNAFNIAFSAIAWPLGCIMLVRQVAGTRPVAVLAAGILSAAQLSFPALLLVWGPLYPNALSVALLPAVIAAVASLASVDTVGRHSAATWCIAIALALPGLATAHTSSLNALIAFTLPILVLSLIAKFRRLHRIRSDWQPFARLGVLAAAVTTLLGLIWIKVRPDFYDNWGPHQTEGGAVGEALTSAPMGTSVAWTVTVLMGVGFVSAWSRPKWRWVPLSYLITVTLYVVDASMPRGAARAFLTGVWYQDTYRLAAFLPLFTTLLAAFGAIVIEQRIRSWALAGHANPTFYWRVHSPMARIALYVVFIVALAAATQYGALRQYVSDNKVYYSLDASSPMLTTDENKLLRRISTSVPPDAVIADNPWNGSSLAYAIADRKVLIHHLFSALSPGQEVIARELGTNASDDVVCPAVKANNVKFVLDFGDNYLAVNGSSNNFPGVTNVKESTRLQLVDSEGAAKLYRVVGCN
ncbi:DUF6541 family protein [Arthrobacter sp. NPDC057259]|uniref:DUF6541 family protein n=1 Tax=Arthrobacter sp. NPDC057259 TaxID=3346073 RepID=UPI003626B0AE